MSLLTSCAGASDPAAPVLPQYAAESKSGTAAEQPTAADPEYRNENGFYPIEREQPMIPHNDEDYPKTDDSFTGFSGIELLSKRRNREIHNKI